MGYYCGLIEVQGHDVGPLPVLQRSNHKQITDLVPLRRKGRRGKPTVWQGSARGP